MTACNPAASQDGIDLAASREYRVMTYNFGGRQSGFCSSPAKERTLLEKLGHDVPTIIERCDVVLFQEVNAEWAPNIVASFPGTWNLHFAKEPTLFTCRNSDVRQTDEMSAMPHVPGSGVLGQPMAP